MVAPRALDGLVLAATVRSDRSGEHARRGLTAELADTLERRLAALRALDGKARERAIAALAAGLAPDVDPEAPMPLRAAAILAADVPRAIGARWLERAPLPRPGFRAPAALRATLRDRARRTAEPATEDREQADADRRAGREILTSALRDAAFRSDVATFALPAHPDRAELLALVDTRSLHRANPERAPAQPGATDLHDPPRDDRHPEEERAFHVALARAALAAGAGRDVDRVLGAMARAARGADRDSGAPSTDRDSGAPSTDRGSRARSADRDSVARAGREAQELRETAWRG
jgi:hypothetical protein